jgi:DNA repair exonuclease SbcCD ATPase subunit
MISLSVILVVVVVILAGLFGYFIYVYAKIHFKYKDIIDLDSYKDKVKKDTEKIINDNNSTIKSQENKINELLSDYAKKRNVFEELLKSISIYDEQLEIISYGLYKPHFDFDTSEKYKQKLEETREKEKLMIKDEKAAICSQSWSVSGSLAEGKRVTKNFLKLALRAFNGECEALIADVRWNNIQRMEERMQKAYDAINKMGSNFYLSITKDYYNFKLEELRLTYEYQEKLHQEKEEQRRIQEQIREEEKVQKEIEKALKDSEDEEKFYNKALDQAKKDLEKAKGAELTELMSKISNLEKELQEAKQSKERALSMAQQTKAGHVYVISNIGSFGENVFKIGMTRRLEPMDRIRELGDSSVPFNFDIHAIIYSDNAPTLENEIHKHFDHKKINLINDRREFFRVTIDEIENIVKKYKADIEIVKVPEAREYRETESIRNKMIQNSSGLNIKQTDLDKFPESL